MATTTTTSVTKPTLTYFNAPGRAEIPRLILEEAAVDYDYIGATNWPELKKDLIAAGKLAFGQVPLYEEPGHVLVQSGAIVRYLARKHGFIGTTEQETSLIDAAAEGAQDLINHLITYKYVLPEEKKEEGKEKLLKETLPTQLGYFTALLEKNGKNGFLVGSKLSFADLTLFAVLKAFSHQLDGASEVISRYPVIESFVEGISNRDRIKAYAARNVYNL